MAMLILAMGIDPGSGRREARQFCSVLTSALENCEELKDQCLRNYHVAVTQALATVKAGPADALHNPARLNEYDDLYFDGKRISERIQGGALNEVGARKASKELAESCGLIYAGVGL